MKEKTNYKVHILVQGSKTPASQSTADNSSTPSTSRAGSEPAEDNQTSEKSENAVEQSPVTSFTTPTMSSSGLYSCHACAFSTTRLNVLIMHNKTHSITFTPYTPSPVRKKVTKAKTTPNSSKTLKVRKIRKERATKENNNSPAQKRLSQEQVVEIEVKKAKTDEEIKSSLLADWDDDAGDDSNDEYNNESTLPISGSPEVPVGAESPDVPTPAELPSAQIPVEISPVRKSSEEQSSEKPESSSDSKYEFCEDEDWSLEADAGRKIPRVKNPKRKESFKSLSVDDDDVAREVAEFLNKTVVPELPSVPEPLKVEENFPELSIAKSPDKKQDFGVSEKTPEANSSQESQSVAEQTPKTIFKTKTFFRSRHSRSQDAIGKYVAEQLNAAERMDMSESEINGAEVASSPEPRESPVEHIKVARLAPKIQLKKMKAEAAQQQKERNLLECNKGDISNHAATTKSEVKINSTNDFTLEKEAATHGSTNIDPAPEIVSISNFSSDYLVNKDDEEIASKSVVEEMLMNRDDTKRETTSVTKENVTAVVNLSDVEKNISEEPKVNYEKNIVSHLAETAVDALLSVSRETDRVTKNISDDPPEDLFEDDQKESGSVNILNGYNEIDDKEPDAFQAYLERADMHVATENGSVTENCNNILLGSNEKTPANTTNDDNQGNLGNSRDVLHDNAPSESDLQIAEALINLPSTAIQNKTFTEHEEVIELKSSEPSQHEMQEKDNIPKQEKKDSVLTESPQDYEKESENIVRYETEQEKSENLNAAQSLVQMSESIDHSLNFVELNSGNKDKTARTNIIELKKGGSKCDGPVEPKLALISNEISTEQSNGKTIMYETSSPKLLKILEEPAAPKATNKTVLTKQVIMPVKEKILNFDVSKQPLRGKSQSPKQKIIIRRTMANKNLLNNVNEVSGLDKIILSRSNKSPQDGSSVQTYTIQTSPESPSDTNTILIQQKIRKVNKPLTKLQKIKPQTSLVAHVKEIKPVNESPNDETIFDINSMPVVLSDDILTPENIEKMPIVMPDGNIITNTTNKPKLVKAKQTMESEKITINPMTSKTDIKTIVMNPSNDGNKVTTPNILSKSSKLRGAKPMLVIEKATGKKKIIMTQPEPVVKEIKQTPTLIQTVPPSGAKSEKFLILPPPTSPRSTKPEQKIVFNPQTGKAHVIVGKGSEGSLGQENKTVSAKLLQTSTDNTAPGSTVMIITNSQGTQSKIILTPEHEKLLFPNKSNVSQIKAITHRITTNSGVQQKAIVPAAATTKSQTRIVPKQKSAIITSKGQLIVGGLVTSTQNIAPMPEIRPALKRIVPAEPKKIVQAIHKDAPEPLIFFQRKSGAVMQLTTAQFEHLQRTGQVISKSSPRVVENKMVVQKSITVPVSEQLIMNTTKQRVRKGAVDNRLPIKKAKQEIPIAPAPAPISPMPALTPLSNTTSTTIPPVGSASTGSTYPDLENYEELLPSTAIARQSEPVAVQPELDQPNAPPQAAISDGQLLAVPGEHFGGLPGSFYLCVEDNGNYTIVDNRPLMLENNQLVPMAEPLPVIAPQPERRDILEAALANSDVFHAETAREDGPDFRDLNANVSVHCRVSETSTTLNQPIMTPVEVPTKGDAEPTVPANLEDGLAVIGVTPQTVPTSLELPITVTDPRIAPKTTDPLSNNKYGTSVTQSTELSFASTEKTELSMPVEPISMPLLTDDEPVGKSMPILTDDVTDRTVSSVESTIGSPSSIDVRESETEDSSQWSQRLFTPGSDSSETSSEIPLQPAIKLSVSDITHTE